MSRLFKQAVRAAMRRLVPAQSAYAQTQPLSRAFGMERGQPIDRYYIDAFIEANRSFIRGVTLEVAEPKYSAAYRDQLQSIEILHVTPGAKNATIIGDLTQADSLPREVADCFICTQTYNFIFDVMAAVRGSAQLLKPGGVLLASVSGISQLSRYDSERWGDFWRFTPQSTRKLLEPAFEHASIRVQSYGNVLAAKALMDGLSVEDLSSKDLLDRHDPDYPVVIGFCAQKARESAGK
jgi:SAM-dependent methyltransferase